MTLRDRQAHLFFWIAASLLFLSQTVVALTTSYDLSADEAHYWLWSKKLDWSYYSKGPVVALLIRASTFLLGDTEFAVRFPALICSFLFSIAFFFYARACFGPRRALFGWIVLRSALFFGLLGVVITTDPPALLFWVCAIGSGFMAAVKSRPRQWIMAGLFSCLAILSKYTALVIYPGFALYLVISKGRRKELFSGYFLAGAVLSLSSLVPVLLWNAKHQWVNFAHNKAHLISNKGFGLRPHYLLELFGGQVGLIGPIVFCLLMFVVFKALRFWKEGDSISGFLLCSILPLLVVCIFTALSKRVYANWPMPLYIPLVFLLLHFVRHERNPFTKLRKLFGYGISLNLVMLVLVLVPVLGFRAGVPAKYLTMKKLVGWEELSRSVEEFSIRSGLDRPVVIAENYDIASALDFYSQGRLEVYLGSPNNRRMNQYDVWGGISKQDGRDAIVVLKNFDKPAVIASWFDASDEQPQKVDIFFKGDYLRSFFLLKGSGLNPSKIPQPSRF